MSNFEQVFAKGKAFIPFITAGDPVLEVTEHLIIKMAEAGADLIEIGLPFSDPVAEGPVIQRADERALAAGTTTDQIFAMFRHLRQICEVPLAIMTYMNPVFTYGCERFMQSCQETGVDALIVPDLPYEEKAELLPFCERYGVSLISMIAPTSQDRIHMIAREARGFVYCVSAMGVTGVRKEISNEVASMVRAVKEVTATPCAVGFGISAPEQAATIGQIADGVIVGSAIVKLVEQYGVNCIKPVTDYVRTMKAAANRTEAQL